MFESTCFSPLAVEIVWDGHHRCVHICTGQMSPLLVTEHSAVLMTSEALGSLVDMAGHHPSLNDMTL